MCDVLLMFYLGRDHLCKMSGAATAMSGSKGLNFGIGILFFVTFMPIVANS